MLSCLLFVVAVGLYRMRRHEGVRVPIAGLIGLFLLSWPPADWLLSRHLEAWYPERPLSSGGPAQAIVAISATVSQPELAIPYPVADKDTTGRCEYAAWLYSHGLPLPVLACGGLGGRAKVPLSRTMGVLLHRAGVPEPMIWTEEQSRTTHENAEYGAEILRARGVRTIVLVADVQEMLRAELCFRKAGIDVIPAPSSFRHTAFHELWPSWKAIDRNLRTIHETIGLVWYKLRGWI
jgi:uncharacterized SAM-binding protein YcdF (DUF218 family)